MFSSEEDLETCRDLVTVVTNLLTRSHSHGASRNGSDLEASLNSANGSSVRASSGVGGINNSSNNSVILDKWNSLTSDVVAGGCSESVSKVMGDLTKLVDYVANMQMTLNSTQQQLAVLMSQQQQHQHQALQPSHYPVPLQQQQSNSPTSSAAAAAAASSFDGTPMNGNGSFDHRSKFFERRGLRSGSLTPQPVEGNLRVSPGGSRIGSCAALGSLVNGSSGSSPNLAVSAQGTPGGGDTLPVGAAIAPPPPRGITPQNQQRSGASSSLPAISPASRSPNSPVLSRPPATAMLPDQGNLASGKKNPSKKITNAPIQRSLDGGLSEADCYGFALE